MKKLKGFIGIVSVLTIILSLSACKNEEETKPLNPKPENVIESFYSAWETADGEKILTLTCEPMWEVEAKSAEVTVKELKALIKESYSSEAGSQVYYKILKQTEYKKSDKEFEDAYKWAKERYKIEIEGYAVIRVAATYDNGEPVTANMEVIKYENSWYAKDLLGV